MVKIKERWQKKPTDFFKDNWPNVYLWDKLIEVSDKIANSRRVIVPSGHGVGKTWLMARIALWFLYSFYPAKVITTAPTWPQVENLLWSEIRKAHDTSKIQLGGRVLNTEIKVEEDWFGVGFSTRGKATEREFGTPKFQGYHSENLLVILDEAPGVEHEIWTSVETLITGVNNKVVAIGNPTSPSGDFYNACKSPLWNKIKISSFDHPNVRDNKIIIPGAVTREWIEERRQEWGEDSPLWKAKVLGDFPDEGEDTLIPLSWAEGCVGLNLGITGDKKLGVDVARFGSDMTVLCGIFGSKVGFIEAVNKKDTSWTAGRVQVLNDKYHFDAIGVDDTGVGGGVVDALNDSGVDVEAFNFGSEPVEDKFENRKAEIFWNLREAIHEKTIELPDDKELINQLSTIKYSYTRKGKIKMESKDDMRRRGLKSPDKADALAIAYSAGFIQKQPEINIISIE
jgi:hypothetical protein